MPTQKLRIGQHLVGPGTPVYIVAELSANHNQSFDQAARIIHAAKAAGADAVKLQTYTPDTITIASDSEYFRINGGTIWDGRTLHRQRYEAMRWPHSPSDRQKDRCRRTGVQRTQSRLRIRGRSAQTRGRQVLRLPDPRGQLLIERGEET